MEEAKYVRFIEEFKAFTDMELTEYLVIHGISGVLDCYEQWLITQGIIYRRV